MKTNLFYLHVMALMCAFNMHASSSSSSSSAGAAASAAGAGIKVKIDCDAKAEYDLLKQEYSKITDQMKAIQKAIEDLEKRYSSAEITLEAYEKHDADYDRQMNALFDQRKLVRGKQNATAYAKKCDKEKQQELDTIWANIARVPYKVGPEGEKPLKVKVKTKHGIEGSLEITLYPSDNILTIPSQLLDTFSVKYMQGHNIRIKSQNFMTYTTKMTIKDLHLSSNNDTHEIFVFTSNGTGYSLIEMRQIYQTQMGK